MAKKKKVFSIEQYKKVMKDICDTDMFTWIYKCEGLTARQCKNRGFTMCDEWMVEVEYGKKANDKPTDM